MDQKLFVAWLPISLIHLEMVPLENYILLLKMLVYTEEVLFSVVQLIIRNGDKQYEVNCNHIRSRAIQLLCRMNPSQVNMKVILSNFKWINFFFFRKY